MAFDYAALSLILRVLHWLAVAAALAALWVWIGCRTAPRMQASPFRVGQAAAIAMGSALAAGVTALAWPAVWLMHVWPQAVGASSLTALLLTSGGAWLPDLSSLWHLDPGWPLAWRPEPDVPVSAYALRQSQRAAIHVGLALALLAASLFLRSGWKWSALCPAMFLLAFMPRPKPELLLVRATPTTFQQPRAPFSTDAVMTGRSLYVQRCAQCHGAQADGKGALAAQQAVAPSILGAAMFRHQLAGDMHWRIQHGTRDRFGKPRMPAYGDELSADAVWRILDYLRILAAGEEVRTASGWQQALPAPDFPLQCRYGQARHLHALRGRLVHLVLFEPGNHSDERLLPDPRLVTIALAAQPQSWEHLPVGIDCIAQSASAFSVYALAAGAPDAVGEIGGTQLLLDRQGWLRTRALPGDASGWSASDTMCGPQTTTTVVMPAQTEDGIDAMLRTIETTPVVASRFRNRS